MKERVVTFARHERLRNRQWAGRGEGCYREISCVSGIDILRETTFDDITKVTAVIIISECTSANTFRVWDDKSQGKVRLCSQMLYINMSLRDGVVHLWQIVLFSLRSSTSSSVLLIGEVLFDSDSKAECCIIRQLRLKCGLYWIICFDFFITIYVLSVINEFKCCVTFQLGINISLGYNYLFHLFTNAKIVSNNNSYLYSPIIVYKTEKIVIT